MPLQLTTNGGLLIVDVIGALSVAELDPLVDAMDAARQRGPFVILTDTTAIGSVPREVLSAFADRLKRMPSLKKEWLGDAVVLTSPVVRFLLSTLVLIAPLPTKVKVFDRRAEAERWCDELLRAAGVQQPPPPRA